MTSLLRSGVLLLLAGLLAVPASAQEKAGPSVEYEGELPPLIERQTFFGDPQYANAQLSPDGEHVSFTKPYEGQMNVWVKDRGEPFSAADPVTADTTRPVPGYFWTQDSERILYVQDKGGNENYHIYAVDPDAETETDLGVPPAEDLTPYEDVRAQIIAVPEATPGEILVGLNDRNPKYHDVYRLDLATGDRTLVYKNESSIAGWETDLEGNLRLATRQTSDGGTEVLRVEEDTLVSVYECSFEETCSPMRFHKDGERVYMQTNKGPDVDLSRLVLFNPETQEMEVVASDPEGEVDFGGAIFSDATDELLATVYVDERKRVYPKNDEFKADYQFLKNELDGQVSFGSSTEDERYRIVTASSDVDPGSVYLFDREEQSLTKLYESRPEIPSQHLAEMQAITYEARDGLTIPAYLTLPKGVEHKNVPTVIFPHGGPWSRDTWGYSAYAQFFANRGYAVLQPNFRGSTGYGKEFLNAGNTEWGTGAMQHDITDGVQYLVEQGITDSTRVGIFGGSYGGYATLAGLTFTPDVYAAGASYVGPSNLLTLLNSIPPYWAPIKKMFNKRVGDPDDPADKKRLKQQSPFFHADRIDDPLLVIQGANDPRVKKQESDQIVVAARENDVPTQYLVAPEEGHGFRKENNRIAVAAQLEQFFGQHLGGRYQTDVTPEIQARLDALQQDVSQVTLPDTTQTASAKEAESGLRKVDGTAMQPASLDYDLTMKAQGRSIDLSASRTIASTTMNGAKAWTVTTKTKTPRATVMDSLVLHGATLRPHEHHLSGPLTMSVTYSDTAATGSITMRGQSTEIDQRFEQPTLAGSANAQMALASMPITSDFSTSLRVFNAQQQQKVEMLTFEVTGTKTVKTKAGNFDTYVLKMTSASGNASGTLHVRQAAPHHLVKMTAEQSGPRGTRTVTRTLTEMSSEMSASETE